jgi:hypothetical protein
MIFATSTPPIGGLKGRRTKLYRLEIGGASGGEVYEGVKKIFIHRRAKPAFTTNCQKILM